MRNMSRGNFFSSFELKEKLTIFESLINSSFDLKIMKDLIDKENSKISENLKEKKSLEYELYPQTLF
jgi:hypothetical protein